MLVSELISAQAQLLGFPVGDITGDEARLAQFLGYCNEAQRAVADFGGGDWPWLITTATLSTVAEQEYLDLPADFGTMLETAEPYYAERNGFSFAAQDLAAVLGMRARDQTAGQPTHWAIGWNPTTGRQRYELWPTPDAAYEIVTPYRRILAEWAGIEETVAIPPGLHRALRLLAMAIAEERWERLAEGTQRAAALAALEEAYRAYRNAVRGQARIRLAPVMGEPGYAGPVESVVDRIIRDVEE